MQDSRYTQFLQLRALLSLEGIGPARIMHLLSRLNSLDKIFESDIYALSEIEGIGKRLAKIIIEAKSRLKLIEKEIENEFNRLEKAGAKIIFLWEKNYPKFLRKIYAPPVVIYVLGEFTEADNYSVAIVGTRQPTGYGKIQTEVFSSKLSEAGITIVSGMARGIDSIAHRGALKKGGRTIAVIGSGLDVVYPPENINLMKKIITNGAVITEFPLGTKPDAQNFPQRNRIISGVSLGTLVIETRRNGGAIQTAAFALDQNREIFAVPGNLGVPQSEGTNVLIQRGEAKLVTKPEDILDELKGRLSPVLKRKVPPQQIELNLFEQKILELLTDGEKHIDYIANNSGLTPAECLVHLLSLEFKGVVNQLPGKMFVRI